MISHASVPLMQAASLRAEALGEHDAVAAGLRDYLAKHIPEELGHDEQFLEDLEAFGLSKDDVRAKVPWPSLAALIGMQYYWIFHHHPIAFVGYAATIEGDPVPVDFIEEVVARTGLPRDGFRTLLWHSRHDGEHSAELDKALDALPLTPEQTSLIGINVANTHHLLARSIHEMIASFETQAGRVAR
jgi:hypothetical protein